MKGRTEAVNMRARPEHDRAVRWLAGTNRENEPASRDGKPALPARRWPRRLCSNPRTTAASEDRVGSLTHPVPHGGDADGHALSIRPIYERAIDELHQRFREQEVSIFEKHGAEVVAVWQSLEDSNTLIWMLAYRDRAHREEVWAAFRGDPEWIALREKYPVSVNSQVFMMSASDYSRLN